MSALTMIPNRLKVADEVYLVVAEMHRLQPDREDFSVGEILEFAKRTVHGGSLRPGFQVHVRLHCVANLPPNPGRYRMLFASGKARRRLFKAGDSAHPERSGKTSPDPLDVPGEFHHLIRWATERFGGSAQSNGWLTQLLGLRGSGRELWRDEPADEYVRRLREGWE